MSTPASKPEIVSKYLHIHVPSFCSLFSMLFFHLIFYFQITNPQPTGQNLSMPRGPYMQFSPDRLITWSPENLVTLSSNYLFTLCSLLSSPSIRSAKNSNKVTLIHPALPVLSLRINPGQSSDINPCHHNELSLLLISLSPFYLVTFYLILLFVPSRTNIVSVQILFIRVHPW